MIDVDINGELKIKNTYLEVDKISSFYIEEPEVLTVKDMEEEVKCYAVTCDGAYYSLLPDSHVYDVLFKKFIKNSVKTKKK